MRSSYFLLTYGPIPMLLLSLVCILLPDLVQSQTLSQPDGDNVQIIVQGVSEEPLDLSEPSNNSSPSTGVIRQQIYDDLFGSARSQDQGTAGQRDQVRSGFANKGIGLGDTSAARQNEPANRLTVEDQQQDRAQTLESDLSGVMDLENGGILIEPTAESAESRQGSRINSQVRSDQDIYSALGMRAGTFVIRPEITNQIVSTDNVFESPDKLSDIGNDLSASLAMESDWSRNALWASAQLRRRNYSKYKSQNFNSFSGEIRGRLDISSRTSLSGETSIDQQDEPVNGRNELPEKYVEYSAALEAEHRLNRLQLKLRGMISNYDYDDRKIENFLDIEVRDRDYKRYDGEFSATYQFKPGFSLIGETGLNKSVYSSKYDANGEIRGSDGIKISTGIDFNLSELLTGQVMVGYAWQFQNNPLFEDYSGWTIDAELNWWPTRLTEIAFRASTDFEENGDIRAGSVMEYLLSVKIEHALRRHIMLSAGVEYFIEYYPWLDDGNKTITLSMGAEYFFNRSVALAADYEFSDYSALDSDFDHQENQFKLGLRWRR